MTGADDVEEDAEEEEIGGGTPRISNIKVKDVEEHMCLRHFLYLIRTSYNDALKHQNFSTLLRGCVGSKLVRWVGDLAGLSIR